MTAAGTDNRVEAIRAFVHRSGRRRRFAIPRAWTRDRSKEPVASHKMEARPIESAWTVPAEPCRAGHPMRIPLKIRRSGRCRQADLPFIERSRRRQRWFKRLIALTTCLAIALILWISPVGPLRHGRRARRWPGRPSAGAGAAPPTVGGRCRLEAVSRARDRGIPPRAGPRLRRGGSLLSAADAVCRAGSGSWPVALGQLRPDAAAPLHGLRGRRPGPLVSPEAADAIDLAEEPDAQERRA